MSADATTSTPAARIPARPTTYNGVKMRSRLEAAWAEQFDSMGWAWKYEPECFATADGQYLPDFLVSIPGYADHVYVEVKPHHWISHEGNGCTDIYDIDSWNAAVDAVNDKINRLHAIVAANTQCDLFVVATSNDAEGGGIYMRVSMPNTPARSVVVAPAHCLNCERLVLVQEPGNSRCQSCFAGRWRCFPPVPSLHASGFVVYEPDYPRDAIAERFR